MVLTFIALLNACG